MIEKQTSISQAAPKPCILQISGLAYLFTIIIFYLDILRANSNVIVMKITTKAL